MIDQPRTAKELLVEEAIHIRLNHPSLNRNVGLELPRCWMAALKDTRSRPNQRPLAPTDSSRDAMAPPWLPFPLSGGPSLRSARSGGTVQTWNNLHAKLPADPSDILTDPFCVGELHQKESVFFFLWCCLSCLHVLSGGFGRGANEDTGVPVLPYDAGEMVFFLLQVRDPISIVLWWFTYLIASHFQLIVVCLRGQNVLFRLKALQYRSYTLLALPLSLPLTFLWQ